MQKLVNAKSARATAYISISRISLQCRDKETQGLSAGLVEISHNNAIEILSICGMKLSYCLKVSDKMRLINPIAVNEDTISQVPPDQFLSIDYKIYCRVPESENSSKQLINALLKRE